LGNRRQKYTFFDMVRHFDDFFLLGAFMQNKEVYL
jgi:hypothetical protein